MNKNINLSFYNYHTKNKGFTLVELLIVIGIIGILAAAVIIAINPGDILAQARDSTRERHLHSLNTSLLTWKVNHDGWGDLDIPNMLTEICNTDLEEVDCEEEDLIDLSSLVDEGYLPFLPVDPQGGDNEIGTGYFVSYSETLKLFAIHGETRHVTIGFMVMEEPDCGEVTYAGQGSEADPYQISDIHQLQCIGEHDLSAYYILIHDVDVFSARFWNEGAGFEPLGDFSGSLDGQGYSIAGLFINRPGTNNQRLLNVGSSGKVKNLSLVNVNITGDRRNGVLGTNTGTIENCFVSGSITGSWSSGGFVYRNSGAIKDCVIDLNVTTLRGGGVAEQNSGTIESVEYKGIFHEGDRWGGGIVSDNTATGVIRNTRMTGEITRNRIGGGFVYRNYGLIEESFVDAVQSHTGGNDAGGFVLLNYGTITNSYVTGSIIAMWNIGGFVQTNYEGAIIDKSYSAIELTASGNIGGFAFVNDGAIDNSFWDEELSGSVSSVGGTGKITSEMQDIDTFMDETDPDLGEAWDMVFIGDWIDEVWFINDGNDYPRLWFEL